MQVPASKGESRTPTRLKVGGGRNPVMADYMFYPTMLKIILEGPGNLMMVVSAAGILQSLKEANEQRCQQNLSSPLASW